MPTIRLHDSAIAPAPGFVVDDDAARARLVDETTTLRRYLPREPMLLYIWYLGRAFHPEATHDGLEAVCRRVFAGDRGAINRAYRRLIAWGLIAPAADDLLLVHPPAATQAGTAALR